jgi:hypothetical protein
MNAIGIHSLSRNITDLAIGGIEFIQALDSAACAVTDSVSSVFS